MGIGNCSIYADTIREIRKVNSTSHSDSCVKADIKILLEVFSFWVNAQL